MLFFKKTDDNESLKLKKYLGIKTKKMWNREGFGVIQGIWNLMSRLSFQTVEIGLGFIMGEF